MSPEAQELRAEMQKLREEIRASFQDLQSSVIKYLIGTMLAYSTIIIVALKFL